VLVPSARRSLVLLDERLLQGTLGLEEKARSLVKAAPQVLEQPLGTAERIVDGEAGLNPLTEQPRTAEAAGLDLGSELLGLERGQLAGIALIV
jgi:hypothetical protein